MNEPNISLRAEIVGEPDEVQRLKSDLAATKAGLEVAREALQEARMFVGGQAMGMSRTHRADRLLKRIIEALSALDAPAADTGGKEGGV